MSTELALHSTDLSTAPGQTFFSDKQIAALRQLGVEGASNGDLAVFFHVASRTGLDPFARQIYMISRKTKKGIVQTIQTAIDGFRLTARRAADKSGDTLEYEEALWCGEDGVWHDVWLSKAHPSAAKIVVLRAGKRYPAIAHWDEYVQTNYEGTPNQFWAGKPAGQLAKCAEALALRRAFPLELSGVYTDDEMGRADVVEARDPAARPGDKLRAAAGLPVESGEIHDAEVIELPDDEPPISPAQITAMHTMFGLLGWGKDDRDLKLGFVSDALGFTVASSKNLTSQQASLVLDALNTRVEALDA